MKYFFTADEHYGHENVIKYCNRPFSSLEEMEDELMLRHNQVVGKDDHTIHAGDFAFYKDSLLVNKIIGKLNGIHTFIVGSHDYWLERNINREIWEQEIEGVYIVVCHYAMRVWPRSHYGSIQLYGHSHGKLRPAGNQLDIGVDTNNFYPYSFDEIKQLQESN